MDITEAFRTEDLSKTDFFDFVVTPDTSDSHAHFSKQMRTVNAFLGNEDAPKEANNNTLVDMASVPATTTADGIAYDPSFWSDKETVRLESAILDDLNKYCWNDQQQQHQQEAVKTAGEGHIYTLTVLNGIDQSATWYRPPIGAIVKEEEGGGSSPGSMEHLPSGLDIDSILNIIPGHVNGFSNAYSEGTMSPNTDGLIKSETYTYDDSGFADNKDELANSLIIDTPLLEAHDNFNNNNNDWKLNNNNTTNNGSNDSLLRSALQGKAFVRYNGSVKTQKSESNTELRRVLSTPPEKSEAPVFIKEEPQEQQMVPTIVAGIDSTGKVIFEEHMQRQEPENIPNTHSMDDILLSSFPEDFEKLKRIANEVAESVNQYCQLEGNVENAVYSISPNNIGILNSPITVTAPVVSSSKQAKKYKRSNSGTKTTISNATSTSNGVRKERSLHYCSICSKGFKDKYSVNVHIRTHTGEKPFACSLCGKSFRQKAHLAKHYQTHIAQKNAAATGGQVATTKTKHR